MLGVAFDMVMRPTYSVRCSSIMRELAFISGSRSQVSLPSGQSQAKKLLKLQGVGGGGGDTGGLRENVSENELRTPISPPAWSDMQRRQTPLGSSPRLASLRSPCGIKTPVKGAEALFTVVMPSMARQVPIKLLPAPPIRRTRGISWPSGVLSVISKSEV